MLAGINSRANLPRQREKDLTNTNQNKTMKTNSKPLSHFRHMTRVNIANLDGLKTIMRVETPRKREWWLVLPAHGEEDAVCVLLKKISVTKYYANRGAAWAEGDLLKSYAERIIKA